MDYAVFLTGLFLLIAGLGCVAPYFADKLPSRWPMLALALAAIGLRLWTELFRFASGFGDFLSSLGILLAACTAAAFMAFSLSPIRNSRKEIFSLKWTAILGTFALVAISGFGNTRALGFVAPILALALLAGWKFHQSLQISPHPKNSLFSAILLPCLFTAIAAISITPELMEISYDVKGEGNSPARLFSLTLIGCTSLCSAILCWRIWSKTHQNDSNSLSLNLLRRRKIGTSLILSAAVFTIANGAWLAHWLGNHAQEQQSTTLLSALNLGALNLSPPLINSIHGHPDEISSPNYISLRKKLLNIRKALPGTRFTYILGIRNKHLVFLIDAENPSSALTFSAPGDLVKSNPRKWQPALAGNPTFLGPYLDEWGLWCTAVVPIRDSSHNVVALLGTDYPATEWLQPLASRRLAAMGVTLSVALLLTALLALHIRSITTARRIESLSDRLSDAMNAAEFDTWECFTQPFKLNIGERIAATLGLTARNAHLSFRETWQRVHPADRTRLFSLIRSHQSSETEIRLKDHSGQWLWFMLRGRVTVSKTNGTPVRLVGTILNIDAAQRARLETDKQRSFAHDVMESVPNGLAVISPTGSISYANPAFLTLAAADSSLIVGQALSSLIPSLSTAKASTCETTLIRPDHDSVPVQVSCAPLSESNDLASSILSVIDLTPSKEAEQNLLRSRAEANRLALVAKRTDNAVVITDAIGRIEWVNEGFTKISGYSREESIGKSPGSILQAANHDSKVSAYMRGCIRQGRGFEAEILNYSKSGRSYIVHIECQPLRDERGKLTGFMAIERDITHTRRSSRLLEAVASISTSLLSKRLDSSIWQEIVSSLGNAASVDRCYLFLVHPHPELGTPAMSQAAEWNSGTALAQIQNPDLQNLPFQEAGYGKWYEKLLLGEEISGFPSNFPPEQRDILVAQDIRSMVIVPIFASKRLWGFIGFDACTEDRVWQSWEVSILRSAAANIGLRQVVQDESDALVLAHQQAHQAALNAEKANQAKSTFLATMSHEIRTPLNAVIGMASLLETTSLNSQQQDFASTILNSSNFLLEIINDILDYSRIESGKIDLEAAPITLADICRDAFDIIRTNAAGKDIELIAHIAQNLPPQLEGDHARIRQILINLLGNSVKFTPSGFISLSVDGHQTPDKNWAISLKVCDSGVGIAPEILPHLFSPFIQEDSSTTRRYGGSGLGLAISKRLAKLMGGDISVLSTPGNGSSFTVTLSLAPAALSSALADPLPRRNGTSQLSILIVDDNSINRQILEETLAIWGLSCHRAASAREAIELWNLSGPYDLVITDHHMPEMNGADLTLHLRALPNSAHTHFSLLSSETNLSSDVRNAFHEVGSKPIWPSYIHGILTRAFPAAVTPSDTSSKPLDEFESERLGHLKVLVAEDNSTNQKVIRLLLRRLGIEADLVANGLEAVNASSAQAYDIILLDIQMPVMDGLEAARQIRKQALSSRPFIIALTANVFREDRDATVAAGMDGYLSKPVSLSRLRETFSSIALPRRSPPPPNHETNTTRYQSIRNIC